MDLFGRFNVIREEKRVEYTQQTSHRLALDGIQVYPGTGVSAWNERRQRIRNISVRQSLGSQVRRAGLSES